MVCKAVVARVTLLHFAVTSTSILTLLQDTGIWKYVEELLDTASPTKLLLNLCWLSAATSAVLTNDTTCLMLTPLVLNLCKKRGAQSTLPFLMAVATSSNIGSSLTIIGNPQNALIASISPGMGFLTFMKDMLLPVLLGLSLNTVALWCYFRKSLVFENPEVEPEIQDVESAVPETSRCWQAVYAVAVGSVVFAMIVGWMRLGFWLEAFEQLMFWLCFCRVLVLSNFFGMPGVTNHRNEVH